MSISLKTRPHRNSPMQEKLIEEENEDEDLPKSIYTL